MVNQRVLIDNDDVKVTEVIIASGETHAPTSRLKRVVINLNDSHIERRDTDSQADSVHQREGGAVVFREASTHEIKNVSEDEHHSIIIELKE